MLFKIILIHQLEPILQPVKADMGVGVFVIYSNILLLYKSCGWNHTALWAPLAQLFRGCLTILSLLSECV